MKQLQGVQYLRAVACVAVVFFHSAARFKLDFSVGQSGVDLFFIISGFLMVAITNDDSNPKSFLLDRIRRITPVYWIATSVFLAGALVGLFPNARIDMWHVLSSYLFIPAISPSDGHSYPLLVPGWTLNYEMFFYACFAVILALPINEAKRLRLLSAAFLALVSCGQFLPMTGPILSTYAHPIVLEFIAGCWIGLLWKTGFKFQRVFGVPTLVLAILILASISYYGELPDTRLRPIAYGIPMVLVFLSVMAWEERRAIADSPWRILGDASYSIYLWHTLAISVAVKLAEKLSVSGLWAAVMSGCFGILVGMICYFIIERPIITTLRKFHNSRCRKNARY